MSIDGIKSRSEKQKSLDGFSVVSRTPLDKSVAKATASQRAQAVAKRPVKSVEAKKTISNHTTPKQTNKTTTKKVSEEFLAPVETFDFDISSDEISENELKIASKKSKKPKKKKHVFRRVLIIFFALLLIFGVAILVWGNDIIAKITGGQSGILDVISFTQENYVDLKTGKDGRSNVLVFGTSGYDMEGTNGDYAHDGAQLTDTIMVISLDQKTGDVAMINLPRDLKVAKYCTGTGKINEVYWCHNIDGNDEEAGAKALVEEVESILDIEIQYYAHVNWETLVSVVDALGSIEVTLDEDIYAACDTGVYMNLYAGVPQVLNGKEALCVARTRYNTQNGDFSRNASQQKILIALKDRVLEKGLGIVEGLNIVNSLGDNVRTNISLEEMKAGMHLLKTFDMTNMRQIPLLDPDKDINYIAYAMENNISYVVPYAGSGNYLAIQKYVNQMLSSDPVVREGSTIEILNGTGESGIALREQKILETNGFNIELIGDAPEGEYEDFAIYILNEEMVGTKAKLEEYYNTKVKSADEIPGDITSGCDFLIVIGAVKNFEE